MCNSAKARINPEWDVYARDAALWSSAAPTVFDIHVAQNKGKTEFRGIDGGIVCNNPTISAMAEAKKIGAENLYVLSIGTGKESMKTKLAKYSAVRGGWVKGLISIFMDGQTQMREADISNYTTNSNHVYHRLQVELPDKLMSLDNGNPENIEKLKEAAKAYTEANEDLIQSIADDLVYLQGLDDK